MSSRAYFQRGQFSLLFSTLLSLGGIMGGVSSAIAQSQLPACQAPQAREYILLVVTETAESRTQIRRTLPTSQQISVCQYRGSTITRIGGFRQLALAQRWARYIKDIVGLPTAIARPPSTQSLPNTAQTIPVQPNNSTVRSLNTSIAYNPQPLGVGYAVLIDYFNQPEVATQARQLLGRDVGLATYFGRPYLLATYTGNQVDAQSLLRNLQNFDFRAFLVDSSQVTLLTPVVRY